MSFKRRILFIGESCESLDKVPPFEPCCYEVISAMTLREGLSAATSSYFDLYLVASCICEGKGFEFGRRVRRFDTSTPILCYTAVQCGGKATLEAGVQGCQFKADAWEIEEATVRLIAQAESKKQITFTSKNRIGDRNQAVPTNSLPGVCER